MGHYSGGGLNEVKQSCDSYFSVTLSLPFDTSNLYNISISNKEVMDNYTAFLTLIGDINNSFSHLEDEDSADICDGDIKLLDKAVKRFKTTVWENQLK